MTIRNRMIIRLPNTHTKKKKKKEEMGLGTLRAQKTG